MLQLIKLTGLFLIFVLTASIAKASEIQPSNKRSRPASIAIKPDIFITPLIGYRYDEFQWSLPSSYAVGGKLCELTWRTSALEAGLQVHTNPEQGKLNYLGKVKYGAMLRNSTSRDLDWDRYGEYSRTLSKVKGGIVESSLAVGYSTQLSKYLLTYYGGLNFNNFDFKDYGLNYQTHREFDSGVYLPEGQTVPNSLLVSTYQLNKWEPWIGVSMHYQLDDKMSFTPLIKGYFFSFHGKANWLLITRFKHDPSFTHNGYGWGIGFDGTFSYIFNENLSAISNIELKKLIMSHAREALYFSDGRILRSNLKTLSLFTGAVVFGLRYKI